MLKMYQIPQDFQNVPDDTTGPLFMAELGEFASWSVGMDAPGLSYVSTNRNTCTSDAIRPDSFLDFKITL